MDCGSGQSNRAGSERNEGLTEPMISQPHQSKRDTDNQHLPSRRDQIKNPNRRFGPYKETIQGDDRLCTQDMVERRLEGIHRWSGTYTHQVSWRSFKHCPCAGRGVEWSRTMIGQVLIVDHRLLMELHSLPSKWQCEPWLKH